MAQTLDYQPPIRRRPDRDDSQPRTDWFAAASLLLSVFTFPGWYLVLIPRLHAATNGFSVVLMIIPLTTLVMVLTAIVRSWFVNRTHSWLSGIALVIALPSAIGWFVVATLAGVRWISLG